MNAQKKASRMRWFCLFVVIAQICAISSAASQERGVWKYGGRVLATYEGGKILYAKDWGPVYPDTEERVPGYIILEQDTLETLWDYTKEEVYSYFKKTPDGSVYIYDKNGDVICTMDAEGYIRDYGSDVVYGYIHEGVYRQYMNEEDYTELTYENFPERYLFALRFPSTYVCTNSDNK